jgi:cation diffusion facilitator CzcD-associated flavoprotein CzcO
MTSTHRHVSIAIIGSGFSGLSAAIRLDKAGHHDFVVLERGDDVGGPNLVMNDDARSQA